MGDNIYGWTRSGYNLLQDKIKLWCMQHMWYPTSVSNRILDFFWEFPSCQCMKAGSWLARHLHKASFTLEKMKEKTKRFQRRMVSGWSLSANFQWRMGSVHLCVKWRMIYEEITRPIGFWWHIKHNFFDFPHIIILLSKKNGNAIRKTTYNY